MHSQWPDRVGYGLWTRIKQYFRKVLDPLLFLSIQLCVHYLDSILFSDATLGEIGNEFYFVLRGSVKIKVNNRIVKVRCSLRLFAPLSALTIDLPYAYPDDRLSHPAPLVRRLAKRPHSASLRCNANANALPRLVRLTQ